MTNPDMASLKSKLAAIALSVSATLGQAAPAMAIQGRVSYTEFLTAVNNNEIMNVKVGPSGTFAEF